MRTQALQMSTPQAPAQRQRTGGPPEHADLQGIKESTEDAQDWLIVHKR